MRKIQPLAMACSRRILPILLILVALCIGSGFSVGFANAKPNDDDDHRSSLDVDEAHSELEAPGELLDAREEPEFCSSLAVDRGPCRARLTRYYYDSVTGTCKLFFYGGCCGNANHFKTKADCAKFCVSLEASDAEVIDHYTAVAKNQRKTVCKADQKRAVLVFKADNS